MKRILLLSIFFVGFVLSYSQTAFFRKIKFGVDFTATPFKISDLQTLAGVVKFDYPVSNRWLLGIHSGLGVMLHNKSHDYTSINQVGINSEFAIIQKQAEKYAFVLDLGDGSVNSESNSHYYYKAGLKVYMDKRFYAVGVQHLFSNEGVKSNSANLFISYGFKL